MAGKRSGRQLGGEVVRFAKNLVVGLVAAERDLEPTAADPLENLSVGAYSFCLDTSTRNNWFNSWSKLCERELGQIRPAEFPTASELHEDANDSAPVTDIEPAVNKLAE